MRDCKLYISEELRSEDSLLLYIPDYQVIFRAQRGNGGLLTVEELDEGYDEYIDYDMFAYAGTCEPEMFKDCGGGVYIYKSDEVSGWQECIPDAVLRGLNNSLPEPERLTEPVNIIVMGTGDEDKKKGEIHDRF